MKVLSLLLALYACASGEQWTRYPKIYPKIKYGHLYQDNNIYWEPDTGFNEKLVASVFSTYFIPRLKPKLSNILNDQVPASTLSYQTVESTQSQYRDPTTQQINDSTNLNPDEVNHLQNEPLRSYAVQSSFVTRPGVNDFNNYLYFFNKTNISPQSGQDSRYWLNENNQNYHESILIPPQPSWNLLPNPNPFNPFVTNPVPDVVYQDNNDWNQWDQNQNDCHYFPYIIKNLRVILHNRNLNDERNGLIELFRIIKEFILSNNLEYASFNEIVREIGRILLGNDRNNLRESEIADLLQQFKNQEIYQFLNEIRSHPKLNLRTVVSKLAQALYRLKQVLIQKGYSQENVQLVLTRAVQWSVPLVGYYFEKECKIKTQQFIVQNLEVALNVKLENVEHVGSIDKLQIDPYSGGLVNSGGIQDLWGQGVIGYSGSEAHTGGLGNLWNIQGQAAQGNYGLADLVNQENHDGSGGLGSNAEVIYVGGMENLANSGVSGANLNPGYPGNPGGVGQPMIPLKHISPKKS